jgi:hypothetical protein
MRRVLFIVTSAAALASDTTAEVTSQARRVYIGEIFLQGWQLHCLTVNPHNFYHGESTMNSPVL